MMRPPFQEWLAELEGEESPELWCFSHGGADRGSFEEWVGFLRRAVRARAKLAHPDGVLTSYAWHDEQASQLRFATARCDREHLPFGCTVVLVDDPSEVVAAWLRDPGYIPWSDLKEVGPEDEAVEPEPYVLRVWAQEHR